MHSGEETHRVLSDAERKQFVHHGFVKLENAFPSETAAEARAILGVPPVAIPTTERRGLVQLSGSETLRKSRFARQ